MVKTYWLLVLLGVILQIHLQYGQMSSIDDAPAAEEQCFAKEKCSSETDSSEEKSKYNKENNEKEVDVSKDNKKWKKYLNLIEKALEKYEECPFSNCSCYNSQIQEDLKPWTKSGISLKLFQETSKTQRVSHYQVINHKLYRSDDPMFPARSHGVEYFLLKIIKDLPDTEFILNTMDWPQTQKWTKKLPVFSFSKVAAEHSDIMYPAWTFWEGGPAVWPIYPNGLGRWDQQLKAIPKAAKKWPWNKKLKKAFFRGSRTSPERDPLVLLSRKEPELVDASYTKNQGWKSDKDTLGAKPATEISLEDHCEFKYLFNFRGVAASFRFKHLFLCDSLVYHVDEKWLEFFYTAMKPWVHYIPVSSDLKEAKKLIQFAIENDDIAKAIARRGRKFILEHLRMSDVTCYWKELLTEYTKLLKYKPTLNKKLARIQ